MNTLVKKYLLAIALTAPLSLAITSEAQASTVLFDGVYATGITNLAVGTDIYNIDFVQGTFTEVFGTTVYGNSNDISSAINGALNNENAPDIIFDNNAVGRAYYVPNQLKGDDKVRATLTQSLGGDYPTLFSTVYNDLRIDVFRSWAVPTTVSAVPLPAALPLYGAGLGLVGLFGWKRRRRTAPV